MKKTVVAKPLIELEMFVGEWIVEGAHARNTSEILHGRVSFEWWPPGDRTFLLQRSSMEHPDFPDSINIIGATRAGGGLELHYFDTRGVHRVYDMTLDGAVWTLSRKGSPGGTDFDQRLVAEFSADRKTIKGEWQRTEPGKTEMKHDFELTYTKLP